MATTNERRGTTSASPAPTGWLVRSAGAGILAGMAMALATMLVSAAAGDGFWAPLRLISALFFGEDFAGEGFVADTVVAGGIIHLVFSTAFGIIFGFLMGAFTNRLPEPLKLVAGILWGLVLWAFNTFLIGNLLPGQELIERGVEVTTIPAWSWAAGHLLYGATLGLLLAVWRGDRTTILR